MDINQIDSVDTVTEEEDDLVTFEDLGLDNISLAAIKAKGFEYPSPIQILAIPRLLDGDANVVAKARTGTGKTAAFGLPMLQKIRENKGCVQALILTPTRELALQVCKEMQSLTETSFPRLAAVYGGQFMGEQIRKLKAGVEIVVGTPGRVKDHLERGTLKLDNIDYFILDEADEMLDMGFIDDIEFIFSKAREDSRVLLFSATMPPQILKIAGKFMGAYEIVEEEERPEEPILTEQRFWFVRESEKINAIVRLIDISPDFYGLIFTQTKADADMVSKELDERGYEAAALHGDIAQQQREKILWRFRKGKTRVLVATDVAARGIDIEGLTHVVNYAMPFDGPTYVHRIGRTGRAGSKGLAFTLVRPEERRKVEHLKHISKGNLKEGKIPTAEEVLAAKKERIFAETAEKITQTDDKYIHRFYEFAQKMCEDKDPMQVLSAVLANSFSEQLSTDRYGHITPFTYGGPQGGGNGKRQTRLYIGLGRKDHMGRPEIAKFFTDLLRIPNRLVDNIEITETFSLVSLPPDAAEKALDLAKKDKRLPHMHIDTKSVGGDSFGGRGGFGGGGRRQRRSNHHGRDDRRHGGGDKKHAGGRRSELREKTSNASLYKKGKKSKGSNLF